MLINSTSSLRPPQAHPAATAPTEQRYFYEKVIKVKADVAALLIFDFRHISTEKFALGSLRSDDW